MTRQQDLDNKKENEDTNKYQFQGHSERSNFWFDLYHEWLEEMFCKHEPNFYAKLYKMNI